MGNGRLLHLASLVQLNPTPKKKKVGRMQIVPGWPQPVAAREPCEQSPPRGETARPETLGIEAQNVDSQGTGFNSSETSKDAEMPCQEQRRPKNSCASIREKPVRTRFFPLSALSMSKPF